MQLRDPQLLKQQAWLEGRWTGADDGSTMDVRNPATGASMVSPATTVASIKVVKPFKDAVAKIKT